MSLCTVAIIEVHPSEIILSQNVVIDQLKNFILGFYHIRTIAHEHINLIGRMANTRLKAQCAVGSFLSEGWKKFDFAKDVDHFRH